MPTDEFEVARILTKYEFPAINFINFSFENGYLDLEVLFKNNESIILSFKSPKYVDIQVEAKTKSRINKIQKKVKEKIMDELFDYFIRRFDQPETSTSSE